MNWSLIVTVALALAGFSSLSSSIPLGAQDVRCSGFQTPDGAQEAFEAYPERAAALDADGDGRACEDYFGLESGDNGVATERMTSLTGQDVDCVDLETQEDAQAVLDRDPDDPFNLDPNGDGVACALLPSIGSLVEGDESDDLDPAADPTKRTKGARTPTPVLQVVASCDGAESWATESLLRVDRFRQISEVQADMDVHLEPDAYSRQLAYSDEMAEMAKQQRRMVVPTSLQYANDLLADSFEMHGLAMYEVSVGVAARDNDVVKMEAPEDAFLLLDRARTAAYDACEVEI